MIEMTKELKVKPRARIGDWLRAQTAAEARQYAKHGACPRFSRTIVKSVGPSESGTGTKAANTLVLSWKVDRAALEPVPFSDSLFTLTRE